VGHASIREKRDAPLTESINRLFLPSRVQSFFPDLDLEEDEKVDEQMPVVDLGGQLRRLEEI
jgi:hypothetical protein